MNRLRLAAAAVLLMAAGCSGDDGDSSSAEACDLLTATVASDLLGVEVEPIGFVDLFERENGPIPDDQRPTVDAAAAKSCAFTEVDGDAVAALQLDRRLFASADEFRGAWADDAEILSEPGLATSLELDSEEHAGAVNVLLNDLGDSFALVTYHAPGIGRDALLDAADTVTDRYTS